MIKKLMSLPRFKEVWSITALTSVIIASYVSGAPWMVVAGSAFGILYVLGVAFSNKYANLFGALLAIVFGYLSYQQGFFGNAAINLLYTFPLSLYGLWLWSKNSKGSTLIEKKSLTKPQQTATALITSTALIGSCVFSYSMGANLWYLDGLSAVLPILGTWFLVNMYKEQWIYWLSYNLLEVVMWFLVMSTAPEMLAIFVMRVVFFINSIFGFINWNSK